MLPSGFSWQDLGAHDRSSREQFSMHMETTQRIVRDHRSPLVLGVFTVLIGAVVWGKGPAAAALGFAVLGFLVAGVRHVAWRATQGAGVCIG